MDLKNEMIRLIRKLVDDAGYDRTIKAVVASAAGNRYRVKFQGAEHSASSFGSSSYVKGDQVWVLLPQNQVRNAVIMGRRNQ